ncbi:MAG: branched-chain amino acid ABC transporter permease [Planctomycetota bacterium]
MEVTAAQAGRIAVNGLTRGAIYALIALGYTMVYGILGMINFAHGEIFMIGAYTGVLSLGVLAAFGWPAGFFGLLLAFAAAQLFAAAFGVTTWRVAYRPLRDAHTLSPLISAIGMSIFFQNLVMLLQGKDKKDFPFDWSRLLEGKVHLAGIEMSVLQLVIIGASVTLMAALTWFIHRTRLGKAMRATAQDHRMAALVGIDTRRVIAVTFAIGSALAGAGGVLIAMYLQLVRFDDGYLAGIKAFTAAVLGGIGNIPGAMLGGLILGLAEDFTASFASDWKEVVAFGVLMLVLILRPRGLLGERVTEKV